MQPMKKREIRIGELAMGRVPRVAGVVSSGETLRRLASGELETPSDLVEVRLDRIVPARDDWEGTFNTIQNLPVPAILTIRIAAEGGEWKADEEARAELFDFGLPYVGTIDIELRSALALGLVQKTNDRGRAALVSFHDYEGTPDLPELREVVEKVISLGTAIPKITTMIKQPADIDTLGALLDENWDVPLCVLGMGALGTPTRVDFPARGSCLTYGFLDTTSAPGQMSCSELVRAVKNTAG